ncbi:MAG: response regulator [Bacteroidetes bacterium]|nr:response regulator [Bacteroidota bacterium]
MENKILVCSHDLSSALKIKIFLEEKGYYVFDPISSGDELIEAALKHYPTLIISDITLKGEIDGIEAISRISGITKIPYIFVADGKENISLIKSYYLHPINVFIKPVDLNELHLYVNDNTRILNYTAHSDYYLG